MRRSSGDVKSLKTAHSEMHQNEIAVVRMSGNFAGKGKTNIHNIPTTSNAATPKMKQDPIATPRSIPKNISVKVGSASKDNYNTLITGTGSLPNRFNPFNRETTLSEDEDDDVSRSNCSEFTSNSDGSGDVSLAELGLTEDYFAHPESLFGLSSVEELEVAIDNCKKMILDLPEKSERRRKFVKRLVELRMKLLELKEGPEEHEPRTKIVLAHKLRKKNSSSMKYYCDCCNNLIWGMLQVWYRCRDCGFNCHSKCVNLIRRECVAVGIRDIKFVLQISPEVGLSSQQFHCAECKNHIAVGGDGKEEARLCDYSGQYFCPQCHWNDQVVTPARILHNWDFLKQNVSRRSYQLLHKLLHRPLLNVQEINPMLFNYVEELSDIRKLREDIILMKAYFTTCSTAREMKLLHQLRDRQHFVDGSDVYSLADLIQAQDGTLTEHLTGIHASFAKHIKLDCLYCQAKGFICEICNSGETLFPFDFGVATCTKCKAVFHRDCFTCIDTLCPRCERKLKKKIKKVAPDLAESASDGETNYMADIANAYIEEGFPKEDCAVVEDHQEKANDAWSGSRSSGKVSMNNSHDKKQAIPEEDVPVKKHSSSSELIFSESSYSDYELLRFAGSGKNRKKSLPVNQDPAKNLMTFGNGTSPFTSDFHNSISQNLASDSINSSFYGHSQFPEVNPFAEIKQRTVDQNKKFYTLTAGNPIEEENYSKNNPFEDDYDESLNPFS